MMTQRLFKIISLYVIGICCIIWFFFLEESPIIRDFANNTDGRYSGFDNFLIVGLIKFGLLVVGICIILILTFLLIKEQFKKGTSKLAIIQRKDHKLPKKSIYLAQDYQNTRMQSAKYIETERLQLRPLLIEDAGFIHDLVNSEGWLQFIGDRNVSNKKDAKNYIQRIRDNAHFYYTVFELKKSRKPIGIVTFLQREDEEFPDFGFALLPDYEKNGYALEASKAYLEEIKNLDKYDTIIAITIPDNKKSIRLLQKLGFEYTGDFQKGEDTLSYYRLKNRNTIHS